MRTLSSEEMEKDNQCQWEEEADQRISQNVGRAGSKISPIDSEFMPKAKASTFLV